VSCLSVRADVVGRNTPPPDPAVRQGWAGIRLEHLITGHRDAQTAYLAPEAITQGGCPAKGDVRPAHVLGRGLLHSERLSDPSSVLASL